MKPDKSQIRSAWTPGSSHGGHGVTPCKNGYLHKSCKQKKVTKKNAMMK